MELVLVVLTAPTPAAGIAVSSQVLTDILWANAVPTDGLQHVYARAGTTPGSHTVGLYLIPPHVEDGNGSAADEAAHTALGLLRRVLATSPALRQWSAAPPKKRSPPFQHHGENS